MRSEWRVATAVAVTAIAVGCGSHRFHLSDDGGQAEASDEGGDEAGSEASLYDGPVDAKEEKSFYDGPIPEGAVSDSGLLGVGDLCNPGDSHCGPGLLCCPANGGTEFVCASAPGIPPRCPL
ncbi:MAG: hypothetical protein ACRELB_04480 [Polyangiaceae bacterium]